MTNLSPEQQEIVNFTDHCLVISCPGSGKTRTLTAKLIHEIEQLPFGRRVAAITYTNIAAEEIHERLNEHGVDSSSYWTGTIHGFCLEWILRPYAALLDKTRFGFAIIDEEVQREQLDAMKKAYGIGVFVNISTRRNKIGELIGNESYLNDFVRDYDDWLSKNRYIDYDLVLYYSYCLLSENDFIAYNLSTIFKWLLVDEYQDTQELQYAIIGLIVSSRQDKTKVMMVGDPNQAIYTGLGGLVKSSNELTRLFGNQQVNERFLVGNYRSTQQIVDFFSLFQVQGEPVKAVGNRANATGKIKFDIDIHKANLHHRIAELIEATLQKGVPHKEIVVIAPQWWLLRDVARKLKQSYQSIPIDAPGVSSLPKDEQNLFFQIARLVFVKPAPHRLSIRMYWANRLLNRLSEVLPHSMDNIEDPRQLLRHMNQFRSSALLGIDYLEDAFSFCESFIGAHFRDIPKLSKQHDVFIQSCKRRETSGFGTDLEHYRQTFETGEGVVFTTLYGCKGQEYHTVIAFGLLENYLPHWSDTRPYGHKIEVSKRQLYVIASRAKENLYLIAEQGHLTRSNRPYRINEVLMDAWETWEMLM